LEELSSGSEQAVALAISWSGDVPIAVLYLFRGGGRRRCN
jgi:hypothetical protein